MLAINIPNYSKISHRKFVDLGYKTIITTNYDYILEELLKDFYDKNEIGGNDSERKYSLYRYRQMGEIKIYHVHGEANVPSSICLGYEHYAGIIEKMINDISRKTKTNTKDPRILDIIKNPTESKGDKTWAIKFFTMDIDIVGLSLYESEIDLWWLITYRAFLKFAHSLGRKLINNKIRYHGIKSRDKGKEKIHIKKKNMLENMDIEYIEHDFLRNNYEASYIQIARKIKGKMESS